MSKVFETIRQIFCPELEELSAENKQLEKELNRVKEEANLSLNRVDIPTEKKSNEFINEALRDSFGVLDRNDPYNQEADSMYRIWQDEDYWCPKKDKFREFLGMTQVSEYTYINDRYDCEDFAGSLRSRVVQELGINSIGIVGQWNDDAHAFNVIVYADGTAELIEPQSAEFIEESDHNKYDLGGDGVFWI